MSIANLNSGKGGRRMRMSRVGAVVVALMVAAGLGFRLLSDRPAPAVGEERKDIAAIFASLQGNVKTRSVGGLDWNTAAIAVPLRRSDLVRTYPSSSAEIKFFDETRVTVRPDSLITIEETSQSPNSTSGRVAWKVSSGEINYETARKESGATEAFTPTFRLSLEGNSSGTMRVGEGGVTAVAQIAGAANIETKAGEKIRLVANEGLRVDAAGKAGAKQLLPAAPSAHPPGDAAGLLSLAEGAPVVLAWSASTGSTAYRVEVEQVTPTGRIVVFDRGGLEGAPVSVPGLPPGEFVFRVAGLTQDGVQGRFSEAVPFRLERIAPARPEAAATIPILIIEAFESRSNVIRLVGKTEPGARLTVNGEPVNVQPDGSFREFLTLARKQGEQRVMIRATSRSGGVAEETRMLPPGQ